MSNILGVGQGRTMAVKNVGTTKIPANRFCLLADSGSDADDSPGITVGVSAAFSQSGSGTIGAYAAVKAIAGQQDGTGATGDVVGVTAGAIGPGSVGTIIVEGPAVVEVAAAFAEEVGDPVQASDESTGSVQGTAEEVADGVRVGVVLVKKFSTTARTFDFNTAATTKYYAVVDVFNRTALGLETDTLPPEEP